MSESDLSIQKFINACYSTVFKAVGLQMYNTDGWMYGASGLASPLLNMVMVSHEKKVDTKDALEKIFQFFEKRKLPHSWWVDAAHEPADLKLLLEKKGKNLIGDFPGMILTLKGAKPPIASDLSIGQVYSEHDFYK